MIQNDHFAASFNGETGTFSLHRRDGTPFLTDGVACANTDAGGLSTASPGRVHSATTSEFRDALGSGRRLTVVCGDSELLLDLRIEIALYDHRPMVTMQARCTNVSS